MELIKKIFKILINSLLILIVVFVLYGFFQLKILKRNYVNYFGYTFFEVISGSMSPTINVYDLVIVKVTDQVKNDDIITFDNEGVFITHRVINYKDDNSILTKGDANNVADKSIRKEDILGRVVKIIPRFGMIRAVIFDYKVMMSIIVTITLFSLALSIKAVEDENKV